ncbi:hypothetical protein KOR42_31840 [Thalassoglobus neptunius]|uniref:Uncharacterized protein n=1 Tax=Thalassoglobus neptunius TaxID=1938619 RepID=A0A5C5WNC2_9PLAN|nr:hypothetical protein [Thalassoglobus neptunius]TWT52087.1 hypothetical protein KOR42_31840 [Thalassoglobus neptunius]
MTTTQGVRKMTLQLTPLLDLLLIVIFAQYMEVQETQVAVEQEASAALVERDQTIAELKTVEAELFETAQRLSVLRGELSEQSQQLALAQDQLETTQQQQNVLTDLLVELFDIPEQVVERTITSTKPPAGRTTSEVERLKERFRQIAVEQSGRVIEHLLSYEEIRKRCDVWDVHVTPDNFLTISSGDQILKMQIPIDISKDFVQQEFIDEFIETAHTLPDPKDLVIMMLTYDRRSQRWATEGVRDALPQIILRMNFESSSRTRYDYADLGFRIE